MKRKGGFVASFVYLSRPFGAAVGPRFISAHQVIGAPLRGGLRPAFRRGTAEHPPRPSGRLSVRDSSQHTGSSARPLGTGGVPHSAAELQGGFVVIFCT